VAVRIVCGIRAALDHRQSTDLLPASAARLKVGADEAPAQQGGRAKYDLLAAADPRRCGWRYGV
jgi:hypothetical protein